MSSVMPVCPTCGGQQLETTTIGVIALPNETSAARHARDPNKATCHECGWKGMYRDCPSPPVRLRLILRDPMQETEATRELLRKASQLMTLLTAHVTCGVDFIAAVDAPPSMAPADEIERRIRG